jgi:hypothetical protein
MLSKYKIYSDNIHASGSDENQGIYFIWPKPVLQT